MEMRWETPGGGANRQAATAREDMAFAFVDRRLCARAPRLRFLAYSETGATPTKPLELGERLQVPDRVFNLTEGGHWQAEVVDVQANKVELYFDADDKHYWFEMSVAVQWRCGLPSRVRATSPVAPRRGRSCSAARRSRAPPG